MNFRYDINGLRAIAVLAVVVFHYNPNWLPGGFSGVDVFFVISGYLMTAIIFRGLSQSNLSLIKFFTARARRIIPALLVVCLLLLIYGWLFLPPISYHELAKHAGSSLLFVSNIVYWQESGYFDASSLDKLLLHTWSLSAEWQFYIIYPIFLFGLSKVFSIKTLKAVVVLGTFLGFVFSVYATSRWPTAAYFLLPTRAWEMMLGGVAFLYPLVMSLNKQRVMSAIGLAMILSAYFLMSAINPWPGYLALWPVLGAYLFILSGYNQSYLMNNVVCQKIGFWSYSIYLVHWPVLVIAKKMSLNINLILYLAIITVLAFLMYQWVEKKRWSLFKLFVSLVLVVGGSFYIYQTDGVITRVAEVFHLNKDQFHRAYYGGAGYEAQKVIYVNADIESYDMIVTGDSYSLQYMKYLDEAERKVAGLFHHGCIILPNYSVYIDGVEVATCSAQYGKLPGVLTNNPKAPLVIAHSWDTHIVKIMKKGVVFKAGLQQTEFDQIIRSELDLFFKQSGKERNYYLIGVAQRPEYNVFECLARTELIGARLLEPCEDRQNKVNMPINQLLLDVASQYDNVYFIDPNDALCQNGKCLLIQNRQPIHSDAGHLSIYGAKIVGDYFMRYIDDVEGKKSLQ